MPEAIYVQLLKPVDDSSVEEIVKFLCMEDGCQDILDSDMVSRHAKYFHSAARVQIDFSAQLETVMSIYVPAIYHMEIVKLSNNEFGYFFDIDHVKNEKMIWIHAETTTRKFKHADE